MRLALAFLAALRLAAADSAAVVKSIDNLAATYGEASQEIWRYAELGFQEAKSSALLQRHLRDAGFTLTSGVAGMPTAFVATCGQGSPVIGILAEFDALPGLSQDVAVVPAIGLNTATAVPGTPGHSWQNAACAGSSIGRKGMVNAAKTLALTAVDLFNQPDLL